MYTKRNYGFWMTFKWSKMPFIIGFVGSAIVFALPYFFPIQLNLPWQPLSVIGIAVAFYLGFKNNSSYDRTWEARKIWGGIVNDSRSFGAAVIAFVKGKESDKVKKELIYRHIAWLTALRYQLRLSKEWEHTHDRIQEKYVPTVCESFFERLNEDLAPYLDQQEIRSIENSTNIATQLQKNQAKRLQELRDQEYFEDFRHMEFHQLITRFYDGQGKAERIKNFPFPRQYASTALWLTLVFSLLIPFGLLDIFNQAEQSFLYWCGPLISALIIWIFFLMEKIGDYSENPFEGTYNDVPITSIARGIEIDMREMIDDDNIPVGFNSENGFLL
ncbi:MAG: bestrophin family ion channel [Vicingaceae bacterium]